MLTFFSELLNPLRLLLSPMCCIKAPPSLPSGVPVQLDRFLPLLLSDHLGCWPLRGHLRLWPLPHQMGPHSEGTYIFLCLLNCWICLSEAATFLSVSSSPHTSPDTLMASTGCGGSSLFWVSSPNSRMGASLGGFKHFIFIPQASCYSCEDSSTTPESARWLTPCPRCPALESSSSIKPAIFGSSNQKEGN